MGPTTDMDRRIAQRVAQSKREREAAAAAVGEATKVAQKPGESESTQHPVARKGDRWATFNAFMDVIAPRLTLAERAVWLVMFRHARNGVCETTVRMLANGASVSRSTAAAALRRLEASGLVWAIWKSKDKARASKYGIHGQPYTCLPRVMGQDDPSRSSGRIEP